MLRELGSCYNNTHTQNNIMENDIPKLTQEKIWGLVPKHHSGSLLLSDRCAFQGTTFIVAGERLLSFVYKIQSDLLDVMSQSAFLISIHLSQQDCYLRKLKYRSGAYIALKYELKYQLSQKSVYFDTFLPVLGAWSSNQNIGVVLCF